MTTDSIELPPITKALAQSIQGYKRGMVSYGHVEKAIDAHVLLAIQRERERAAQACDRHLYEHEANLPDDWTAPMGWDAACQAIRNAIRKG